MSYIRWMAVLCLVSGPAWGQDAGGDPGEGERVFNRCQTCHVVVSDDGERLAGRAGRTGPNLYGVVGRTAGAVEDFRYSTAMEDAGAAGLVWTEEALVPYLIDPTGYLQEVLDDGRARGKMVFRLRAEDEARDVIAYLRSLAEGS